jgi:hypothetical protein
MEIDTGGVHRPPGIIVDSLAPMTGGKEVRGLSVFICCPVRDRPGRAVAGCRRGEGSTRLTMSPGRNATTGSRA